MKSNGFRAIYLCQLGIHKCLYQIYIPKLMKTIDPLFNAYYNFQDITRGFENCKYSGFRKRQRSKKTKITDRSR